MKNECKYGHTFTAENTYTDKRGSRVCKTCRRDRMAARREPGRGQGYNATKTECKYGHPYTEENTYRNPEGRRWCRTCMAANSAKQNVKRYGISSEEVDRMLEAQGHACGICREPFTSSPHLDHDHSCCPSHQSCGDCVRGLLCGPCNRGLGLFKDDVERLRTAVRYIEFSKTAHEALSHADSMLTTETPAPSIPVSSETN